MKCIRYNGVFNIQAQDSILSPYSDNPPERETLEATPGPLILEFGSNTCGICQAAAPLIAEVLADSTIPHIRVQDGKGRRLGRQYGIKLWPTLVMLQDGQEAGRVVRPTETKELLSALELLSPR